MTTRGGQPTQVAYAVVVPTVGRPSLVRMLETLVTQGEPRPVEVVVVDDRPGTPPPVDVPPSLLTVLHARVVPGLGRGPAAARNLGWRLTSAPWVCFLDDDVLLPDGWVDRLLDDLEGAPANCAGVQARLHVPLPAERQPTDWERSTAGLEHAKWATADMAYRREALLEAGGFDERFPRAYREDADLALRVRRSGWTLRVGTRTTTHPVRPSTRGASLRAQRGNADDALMRRLHGRRWRAEAETGHGRLPWHAATTAAATTALAGIAAAPRTPTGRVVALAGGTAYVLLVTDFARRRVTAGPRTAEHVAEMLWTSAAIPVAAVAHRLAGWWRHRDAEPWRPRPRAILFDRDGTLVEDVPYNGDPRQVVTVPTAAAALARARRAGLKVGVVTNQSGVARGLLREKDVRAVNAEVEARLGPMDTWRVCLHGTDDGCRCRKPAPGLVLDAARDLGLDPRDCVVIGDIGSDVLAARAAGASAILVPTPATRPEEVRDAPLVATDLASAVELVLGGGHG